MTARKGQQRSGESEREEMPRAEVRRTEPEWEEMPHAEVRRTEPEWEELPRAEVQWNKPERVGEHLWFRLLVLIGIHALVLLAVLLFCDVKYEVSDDFVMELIASGAYSGKPDSHLMFSSVIWGRLLCALYDTVSGVNWYYFTQIAVCFLACCAVSRYLAETFSFPLSVLLTVAAAAFFAGDLYLLPQFTKSAAAAIASGGLLFLWGIFRGRRRGCVLFGAALVVVGCLLRHNAFYIAVAYLGIYFVFEMVRGGRTERQAAETARDGRAERHASETVRGGRTKWHAAIATAALVALIFVLRWVNLAAYDGDYRYYLDFSYVRAKLVDYPMPEYAECAEELTAAGISENDYTLIREWCFADRTVYSLERMQEVLQIVDGHRPKPISSPREAIRRLIGRMVPVCPGILCCLLLTVLGLMLNRRRIWIALCAGLATALMMLYFLLKGHAVYRVEFGFFFGAAALLLWTLDAEGERRLAAKLGRQGDIQNVEECRSAPQKAAQDRVCSRYVLVCGILTAAICFARLGAYIPDSSFRDLSYADYRAYVNETFDLSWDYVPEKYTKAVNRRDIYPAFLEEIAAHPENLYLLDFNTTIQSLYLDFSPLAAIPQGSFENMIYLGGVTVNHPVIDGALAAWEAAGTESGASSPLPLLLQNHVYFVSNGTSDAVLRFLQEHCDPGVSVHLSGVLDGYFIWEYTPSAK